MHIRVFTDRSNDSSFGPEWDEFRDGRQKTLIHLPVSLLLIILYIKEIVQKRRFCKFSPFELLHAYMYCHVIVTSFGMATSYSEGSPLIHKIMLFSFETTVTFSSYMMSCFIILQLVFLNFNVKSIHIKLFDTECNRNVIIGFCIPVLLIVGVLNHDKWLILNFFDKDIKFELFVIFIDFLTLCIILLVFLTWKFFQLQLDEEGISILINSTLSFFALLVCRIITIFRTIFTENPDVPISFDKYIFNMYYCPFIWILTVYFCDWTPVKAWIQKKVKENKKEEEEIPEFQMAYISVGGAGNRRRDREESVISYLSVSDISVVI